LAYCRSINCAPDRCAGFALARHGIHLSSMKKSRLATTALLLLTLSGCLWYPHRGDYGGYHDHGPASDGGGYNHGPSGYSGGGDNHPPEGSGPGNFNRP
jgi:hypothetical protein